MRAAGVLLGAAGGLLAVRSALLLLGRGRPRRGPQPPFVIAGPYTRTRNPLLGGLLVALAGTALALDTPALLLGVAAAAVAAHAWVVGVEEPRLRARFGEAYREYLVRVPRWVPRFAKRPDEDVT